MSQLRNYWCLLPDGHIVVRIYAPHGCGGMYMAEAWCWGPRGRVGWWFPNVSIRFPNVPTHDQVERT